MTTVERLAAIIREQFASPDIEVTVETTSYDIDGWDSVSHACLMLEIEKVFNCEVPLDVALSFVDVGELAKWLDENSQLP